MWAVVDEEDYHFFCRWRWSVKRSRNSSKLYLRRITYAGGGRKNRRCKAVYLHIEVLKRKSDVKPTAAHVLADHRDGDSLNCRRGNLGWETPKGNARNRRRKRLRWD